MTDDERRFKGLADLLCGAKFDPDNFTLLHEQFTLLALRDPLTAMGRHPRVDELVEISEELHSSARAIKSLLSMDADAEAPHVRSPALLTELAQAFEAKAIEQGGHRLVDQDKSYGGIAGWHSGQFGLWRDRLMADMTLLISLAQHTQRAWDPTDVAPPSVSTKEVAVLTIRDSLNAIKPMGITGTLLIDLIDQILTIYQIVPDAPDKPRHDSIKGILRKHNVTPKSM